MTTARYAETNLQRWWRTDLAGMFTCIMKWFGDGHAGCPMDRRTLFVDIGSVVETGMKIFVATAILNAGFDYAAANVRSRADPEVCTIRHAGGTGQLYGHVP